MLRQYEATDLAPLAEDLHRENRRAFWRSLGIVLVLYGVLSLIGVRMDPLNPFRFWSFGVVITTPLFRVVRHYKRRQQAFTKAHHALTQAMDRSTIGPLLQMRAACQSSALSEAQRLSGTCDSLLRSRLPRATEDELELLSPKERKILVRLLPIALGSPLTKPAFQPNQEPNASEAELATAILLALASLKQHGGEKSARRILKHFRDEALREAAQDYLNSLSA